MSFHHIVVEGSIGVGKTTLTKRLAEAFGFDAMLELPTENPFLARFYEKPEQFALQTQLYFLFQRVKQLRSLSQQDLFSKGVISDFMLEKDPLFAELTLAPDELGLYEEVYHALSPQVPVPDLVIYLQAGEATLQKRIRQRGIHYERNIDPNYLQRLSNVYSQFFMHYYHAPLLIVNAENLNFLDNEAHFELLTEQVLRTTSGRHYFNPVVP